MIGLEKWIVLLSFRLQTPPPPKKKKIKGNESAENAAVSSSIGV